MDGVFISEEVGSPKPHRSFFDHCLAQIGEKDKSRILIVGDSVSSDIKGGMEAGIATCWYRTGEKSGAENQADFVIDDLHQIYDLVGMDFPSL